MPRLADAPFHEQFRTGRDDVRLHSAAFQFVHNADGRRAQVIAQGAGKIVFAQSQHVAGLGAAQHLGDEGIRKPVADAHVHIRVVVPEFVKAAVGRIDLRESVFDGDLRQPRVNQFAVFAQTFRAITFHGGAVEIPEREENGVCVAGGFQDGRPRIEDPTEDAAVVRLLSTHGYGSQQHQRRQTGKKESHRRILSQASGMSNCGALQSGVGLCKSVNRCPRHVNIS